MELFVQFFAAIMICIVLGIYARNVWRRSWDLLSWRNLFLLGFLHFYLLGTWFTAEGGLSREVTVVRVASSPWMLLVALILLFFTLFMLSAWVGARRTSWVRVVPSLNLPVTGPSVVGSVVVLNAAALLASIPIFNYFGLLIGNLRGQLAACAAGLATYYLVSRRFNPAAWLLMAATLGVGLVVSTVGTSGRRMLLGVLLAVPWMFFFIKWRYGRPAANFGRVGVLVVVGVLTLIIYTPFRDIGVSDRNFQEKSSISNRFGQLLAILSNPTIDPETYKMLLYTDTTPITLYALENYPSPLPFEPLRGAKWFVINPIPRAMWPDKPAALGYDMARTFRNTVEGFTIGPGIITHGWVELGLIGVVYYAVFFGLLCGVVDRAVAERASNPFFLAAMGCGLGNVVALPRGDTPLFLIQIVAGVFASMVVLALLNTLYGRIWAAFPPLYPPEYRVVPETENDDAETEEQVPDEPAEVRW